MFKFFQTAKRCSLIQVRSLSSLPLSSQPLRLFVLNLNRTRSLVVRSIFSIRQGSTYPLIFKMRDKVIVKHEEGEDRFTFSFIYSFAQNR